MGEEPSPSSRQDSDLEVFRGFALQLRSACQDVTVLRDALAYLAMVFATGPSREVARALQKGAVEEGEEAPLLAVLLDVGSGRDDRTVLQELRRLVERHFKIALSAKVLRIAKGRRFGPLAQDVAQEALRDLLDVFVEKTARETWSLARLVTSRRIIDQGRAAKARSRIATALSSLGDAGQVQAIDDGGWRSLCLETAYRELSDQDRAIINARMQGFSFQEIARALDISLAAAKKAGERAVDALNKALDKAKE